MTLASTQVVDTQAKSGSSTVGLFAIFGFVSLVLLFLGGWLTYLGLGPWYQQLNFPPFQPPGWVFTPVWLVVLFLLAWATWDVARRGNDDGSKVWAMALYGAQCVLNVGWSLLFFTLRRPDVALQELIVLDLTLLGMIYAYSRVSRRAGWLLVPYLLWLLLSTAINGWIVQFNGPFPGE